MTEPAVASSDATNISCSIQRDGNDYVINGRKWWSSGANDPRCKIFILMGKTSTAEDRHRQQSMILVPSDTPGVKVLRHLPVFGYDDARTVMRSAARERARAGENLLLGEGRGFEIAQGRLGPGRIHHCMRSIGVAERALELMCQRLTSRVAFGKPISSQSVWHERIAESRCAIDQARLMVLNAAYLMDTVGQQSGAQGIAMIKVVVPNMTLKVLDWAIQAHGAGGVTSDFPLAQLWAGQAHAAYRRRPGRGPSQRHREAGAREVSRKSAEDVAMPVTRGG
jgi:acyl-CoA dehydrogenase